MTNLGLRSGLVNGSRGEIVGFEDHEVTLRRPQVAKKGRTDYSLHDWALFGEHADYQYDQILQFMERAKVRRWPVVKFDNGIVCTIRPHCMVEELGHVPDDAPYERFSVMSRTQIPLVAGWAITTHKSQGMTLDKAVVNLNRVWEPGQVYVAFSRDRTLAGLQVKGVEGLETVKPDEAVIEFMREHFGDGPSG